jgi:hypothetical protein
MSEQLEKREYTIRTIRLIYLVTILVYFGISLIWWNSNTGMRFNQRESIDSLISIVEHPVLVKALSKLNELFTSSNGNSPQSTKTVQNSRPLKKSEWLAIEELIASTPQRRLRAARELGIVEGEHFIVFLSIDCNACYEEALKLNQKKSLDRIVAVSVAPADEVRSWSKKLGLRYRVESISQEIFSDLGNVVLLPTIVRFKDGVAIGASETAELIE